MNFSLKLQQLKLVNQKPKSGNLSGQNENDLLLEAALRHSLRTPSKKYRRGHFAALATQNGRRAFAA